MLQLSGDSLSHPWPCLETVRGRPTRSMQTKLRICPTVLVLLLIVSGVQANEPPLAEKLDRLKVQYEDAFRAYDAVLSIDGSIVKLYHVRGYPTVYVIDAEGEIRSKRVDGDVLDQLVENLVAEREAAGRQ
jgi:hypothetical protein